MLYFLIKVHPCPVLTGAHFISRTVHLSDRTHPKIAENLSVSAPEPLYRLWAQATIQFQLPDRSLIHGATMVHHWYTPLVSLVAHLYSSLGYCRIDYIFSAPARPFHCFYSSRALSLVMLLIQVWQFVASSADTSSEFPISKPMLN